MQRSFIAEIIKGKRSAADQGQLTIDELIELWLLEKVFQLTEGEKEEKVKEVKVKPDSYDLPPEVTGAPAAPLTNQFNWARTVRINPFRTITPRDTLQYVDLETNTAPAPTTPPRERITETIRWEVMVQNNDAGLYDGRDLVIEDDWTDRFGDRIHWATISYDR